MKGFAIRQERSAMKVGTDGVLLGAFGAKRALERSARNLLDVGTGTGVAALMAAQMLRGTGARITGIEIDPEAAREAAENALRSPFAREVHIVEGDFLRHAFGDSYDLILSNPPFFTPTHRSPDDRRTTARHIGALTPEVLFAQSASLLTEEGEAMLIFPAASFGAFVDAAGRAGLSLAALIRICTKEGKSPKRVIATFRRHAAAAAESDFVILDTSGDYTPEYRRLLSPYLIIF